MTSRCAQCDKTVYFAEKQSYDGTVCVVLLYCCFVCCMLCCAPFVCMIAYERLGMMGILGKDYHGVCLQAFKKQLKSGVSGYSGSLFSYHYRQTIGFSSYPTESTKAAVN